MYKIGLVYRRHDIYLAVIKQQMKESEQNQFKRFTTELNMVNEAMQLVNSNLEEHTTKQRVFRQEIVSGSAIFCRLATSQCLESTSSRKSWC